MVSKNSPIAEDWYHLSFDALYPVIYAHRTVEAASAEARFSINVTPIAPGDSVLDLCCGVGRHIAHLHEHAEKVTGLDYSNDLLGLARKSLGRHASFVRGDMRALPFKSGFDVVVNYFTSFGYFIEEEENLAVVRGVARALKPGGRFFIDYMNRPWAEKNIQPRSVRRQNDFEIIEERWIDSDLHRINKKTVVQKDGETVQQSGESVRLYTQDEISGLLNEGGLEVTELFGDYDGAPLSAELPRMILVGAKA